MNTHPFSSPPRRGIGSIIGTNELKSLSFDLWTGAICDRDVQHTGCDCVSEDTGECEFLNSR